MLKMMTIRIELIQSSYIAIIFTVLCWVAASEEAVPARQRLMLSQSFRSILNAHALQYTSSAHKKDVRTK
jgi:hypothetical protein